MNRRELLTTAGLGASAGFAGLLAPVRAIGADVKPIRTSKRSTLRFLRPRPRSKPES
jgi:hypothetical protein